MNGFIAKTLTAATLAGGLLSGPGCWRYRDLVDPCYPERYEFAARREVVEAITPQVHNGHVLDQTVWNSMFEYDEERHVGTDRLTAAGMEHLAYLARRRPCPDPNIYLQTAQDVGYDPAVPEAFVQNRATLDALRIAAVQKFLGAYTAGRNLSFNVCLHDPAEVGMSAVTMRASVLAMQSLARLSAGGGLSTASPANVNSSAVNSTQSISTTNVTATGGR